MICRRLNPWEIPDILPLAREFHAEAGVGGEFCETTFLKTLQNPSIIAIGLFTTELIGILVGIVTPHFMTKDVLATELAWYVLPQWRGDIMALDMVKVFENRALELGATCVCMVNLASNPAPSRLYKRLGFVEVESHFLKFIQTK